MRKLTSFGELAKVLQTVQTRQLPRMYRETLEEVGELAQHIAKEELIGRLSPLGQVGTFPAWTPLKDETIDRKGREGLGKNGDPRSILYASGDLHDSIDFHVSPGKKEVAVGTNVPYAAVHEYGSAHVPPRPFLAPAMLMTITKLYLRMETNLCRTLDGSQTYVRRSV